MFFFHDSTITVPSKKKMEIQKNANSSPKKNHFVVPSSKLTWQWKITISNRRYIFKRSIFHGYVSLLGCIQKAISRNFVWEIPSWPCLDEQPPGARGQVAITGWWVQPTHLKNIRSSNWKSYEIFPPIFRDENKKYFKDHHLDHHCLRYKIATCGIFHGFLLGFFYQESDHL